MKKSLILILFLLTAGRLCAQNFAGDWSGTLQLPGDHQLAVIFHIRNTGSGYTATMDSPDQGASGLKVDTVKVSGDRIILEAGQFKLKYSGTLVADSNLVRGNFTQGTASLPLTLSNHPDANAAAKKAALRPQDPVSFPYRQEEVSFPNKKAGIRLAGTLTLPQNGKARKIVILVSGSGPQNRDEEVKQFNHRPFLVWSDFLTRNGIAVLRYDDRGVAGSTGEFGAATSADFADDAAAALDYIASRPDLKDIPAGVIGHSEGGMIAPMLASGDQRIKFIVLLAGPGIPIDELLMKQSADQLRLNEAPAATITRTLASNRAIYQFMKAHPQLPEAQLKQRLDTLMRDELRRYPAADLQGQSPETIARRTIAQVTTPWFRYFITFKPANHLSKVKCPVLALNGSLDMQVNAEANLAGIRMSLQKAGNKHFRTIALPGLNHLFQQAATGSTSEYAQIAETVNPAALKAVTEWISSL
ncbi:alpha/beta hydrolase [Mucilaginibacter conchicola]|uniref:Alpha/beta hydrolase n=1 Tax=Mucilaginibacter conchicola TaxID=2303333 RepID=A0A372NQN7_9SPHI|nr:alpha/beta hydrolase [Mucilaginibacter conchicola]RFZ91251.1 alpha/beta hydrolase [Mucilaginibacter conchicola]